ncbi:hypothetical protein HaLaN_27596 [Haematococcus lacustris]|uniref:Uncharacterized protein n=1 Tax=Haematococcus lacustris TaxID=44745 RepID=A0A6A0A8X6_HAELA|nr:hypothetical protein HaLaN_27596 [Haematococcus lacustris]
MPSISGASSPPNTSGCGARVLWASTPSQAVHQGNAVQGSRQVQLHALPEGARHLPRQLTPHQLQPTARFWEAGVPRRGVQAEKQGQRQRSSPLRY